MRTDFARVLRVNGAVVNHGVAWALTTNVSSANAPKTSTTDGHAGEVASKEIPQREKHTRPAPKEKQ